MLPVKDFKNYKPGKDVYANKPAVLRLDDLLPKPDVQPVLSYMISTYNRRYQLARTLETLCRQTFRAFEVLLMDDGSTQNIQEIVSLFEPFLTVKMFRQEKAEWFSCPSRAYKTMLQSADGNVIAIGHPEMMLHSTALEYLYFGALNELSPTEAHKYTIGHPEVVKGDSYWVSLKPLFIIEEQYELIDGIDWHSNLHNLTQIPGFWDTKGFAGRENVWHDIQNEYPWWFVGATTWDSPLWRDLPTFDGHGIIDMWMMYYRSTHNIVDVVPFESLAYHQPHLVTAVGVEGEQEKHAKS